MASRFKFGEYTTVSRQISSEARAAINAPQTSEVFLIILEINHDDLPFPIRVVNNNESIISNGNTYLATAFSFTIPAQEEGTISNSRLIIDNVDRSMVLAIRSIKSPPDISASVILASDPDTIEAGPWEFKLRNTTYTRQTVSGELVYDSHMRDNCGTIKYTTLNFPGMFG